MAEVPNLASECGMDLDELDSPLMVKPIHSSATGEVMKLSSVSTDDNEFSVGDPSPSTPLGSEESYSHEENMEMFNRFFSSTSASSDPKGVVFDESPQNEDVKVVKRRERNRQAAERSRIKQKNDRSKIKQTNTELLLRNATLKDDVKVERISVANLQVILSALVMSQPDEDTENDVFVNEEKVAQGSMQHSMTDEFKQRYEDFMGILPELNHYHLDPGDIQQVNKISEELQMETTSFLSCVSTLPDSSTCVPSGCQYNPASAGRLTVGEDFSLLQYGKESALGIGSYVDYSSAMVHNNTRVTENTNSANEYGITKESPWVTDTSKNEDDSDLMKFLFE